MVLQGLLDVDIVLGSGEIEFLRFDGVAMSLPIDFVQFHVHKAVDSFPQCSLYLCVEVCFLHGHDLSGEGIECDDARLVEALTTALHCVIANLDTSRCKIEFFNVDIFPTDFSLLIYDSELTQLHSFFL